MATEETSPFRATKDAVTGNWIATHVDHPGIKGTAATIHAAQTDLENQIQKLNSKQAVHPAPAEATEDQLATDPILWYFHYKHLPEHLQEVSEPLCRLALQMVETLPHNAERSAGLRKLLEAKDCFVRARVE